jgi:hypothetical protein
MSILGVGISVVVPEIGVATIVVFPETYGLLNKRLYMGLSAQIS